MLKSSWFTARRLQTQLWFWTLLVLFVAQFSTIALHRRFSRQILEENARERSERLVQAVDRFLSLQSLPSAEDLPVNALRGKLSEFVEADTTLTRLDVVEQRGDEVFVMLSSSDTRDSLIHSIPAVLSTDIQDMGDDRVMISSHPVTGTPYAIVALSSLAHVDRFLALYQSLTPIFAGLLFLVVSTSMLIVYKRTISRRFDQLLEGIRLARDGQVVHLPDDQSDEISSIARTLNELLAQARSFNEELRSKVAMATDDLNKRNIALEEATRQMLAMQRQLLESQRLATVGQMAATFAHEIGSPMSSLSAHVQLLLEDQRLPPDDRETLSMIREQIRDMIQIVNEMLMSARRGPLDFVPTDMNSVIRTVIDLVQPRLMSQKVSVRAALEPVPPVRGYSLYLQEAFLNVVNNASDAMPDGGDLIVRSWFDLDSGLVNITFTDNGPGVSPAIVERMFERLVTTKAIGAGTGLGLGIVKEIVENHRGVIEIGSTNGRGTVARFTFPVESTAVLKS